MNMWYEGDTSARKGMCIYEQGVSCVHAADCMYLQMRTSCALHTQQCARAWRMRAMHAVHAKEFSD